MGLLEKENRKNSKSLFRLKYWLIIIFTKDLNGMKNFFFLLLIFNYQVILAQESIVDHIIEKAGDMFKESNTENFSEEYYYWDDNLDREVTRFQNQEDDQFVVEKTNISVESKKKKTILVNCVIDNYWTLKDGIKNAYQNATNKDDFQISEDVIEFIVINKSSAFHKITFNNQKRKIVFENSLSKQKILESNHRYIKDKIKQSEKIISEIKKEINKNDSEFNPQVVLDYHVKLKSLFNDINWGGSREENKISDRKNILNSHIKELGKIESSISHKIQDKAKSLSKSNDIDNAEELFSESLQVLYFIRYTDKQKKKSISESVQKELDNLTQVGKPYGLQEPLASIIKDRIEEDLNSNITWLNNSSITYEIRIDQNGKNKSECKGCTFESKIGNTLKNRDGSVFQDKIQNTQFHKIYQGDLRFEIRLDKQKSDREDWAISGNGKYITTTNTLTIEGSGLNYKSSYTKDVGYKGKGSIYALYGLIPGIGMYVYDEDSWEVYGWNSSYHTWRTFMIYPAYGLSILFNSISNKQYEKYQSATNQADIDKYLNTANATGTIANYTFGFALTLHLSEITEILIKGISVDRKKNRMGRNFSNQKFEQVAF